MGTNAGSHRLAHDEASTAMLGGIGFTVSIFIATLSFDAAPIPAQADLLSHAKQARHRSRLAIVGTTLAFFWLHLTLPKGAAPDTAEE